MTSIYELGRPVLCVALLFAPLTVTAVAAETNNAPRVFLLRADSLAEAKRRLAGGDAGPARALQEVVTRADRALDQRPPSVMDKPDAPPSGDKHDYMSLAPYWWPNPDTADGLPYVRRDGEVYKDRNKHDTLGLRAMTDAVRDLGLAYYFSDDERYAAKCAEFLRVWFIKPESRMNPNLNFAQGVPGRTDGRCYGIIDTTQWRWLIEAIGMIGASSAWTDADQATLQQWFREYLDWLMTSPNGTLEAAQSNNHGTWWAVQTALYALFVGDADTARTTVEGVKQRIARQVEPDGHQPREAARTKGLSYSCYNLDALMCAARLGEHVGLDLWSFETEDGRSIRKALDYLIPYGLGDEKWEGKQIAKWKMPLELLRRASVGFQEPRYERLIADASGGGGGLGLFDLVEPARHAAR